MKKVEEPCDDLIESGQYKTLLLSVQQFKNGLDKIRKQEVKKYMKKISRNEKELMESFTNGYIRKIINIADEQVRVMPENSDTEALSVILAELFNSESPFLQESFLKKSIRKNSISLAT